MTSLYQQDPYAWFAVQASLLLGKNFENLDIENLAEELLEMGESYARELESNLTVLFLHLLKQKYQPDKQTRSWSLSIKEHRRRSNGRLEKTPSLKYRLFEIAEEAYRISVLRACEETELDYEVFPPELPWHSDDFLREGWLP